MRILKEMLYTAAHREGCVVELPGRCTPYSCTAESLTLPDQCGFMDIPVLWYTTEAEETARTLVKIFCLPAGRPFPPDLIPLQRLGSLVLRTVRGSGRVFHLFWCVLNG